MRCVGLVMATEWTQVGDTLWTRQIGPYRMDVMTHTEGLSVGMFRVLITTHDGNACVYRSMRLAPSLEAARVEAVGVLRDLVELCYRDLGVL